MRFLDEHVRERVQEKNLLNMCIGNVCTEISIFLHKLE